MEQLHCNMWRITAAATDAVEVSLECRDSKSYIIRNTAATTYSIPTNVLVVIFGLCWYTLFHYAHIVDPNLLAAV